AIILLLAAVLLLSVVGCKKADDKKLTIAISPDFAPMEFVDTSKTGQDQYVGFDVTLANYLAQELGMELELKPMSFDACQTAVQLGSVDMSISGFSWTAEREENYLLSDYYIAGDNETQQSVITVKAKEGTVTEAAGFAGWKVGAQAASLQEKLVQEALLPAGAEMVTYKSIDDAVLALQTGKIDALAVAHGNGEAIISNNPDIAFTGYDFEVDPKYENNVILLNKNSTELLKQVNAALAKALAANLYDGWYEDAKALAGISTAAEVSYNDDGSAPTN
ncbi:MAG: transporter substrate-binding domain-containing protein, partial [Clostridia bacterium]|nr:transporter substrate-binding domain-containing protein [Clostridia bacterium]